MSFCFLIHTIMIGILDTIGQSILIRIFITGIRNRRISKTYTISSDASFNSIFKTIAICIRLVWIQTSGIKFFTIFNPITIGIGIHGICTAVTLCWRRRRAVFFAIWQAIIVTVCLSGISPQIQDIIDLYIIT